MFNYKDVVSLFDRNQVTEEVIDFAMDAFNFYNMTSDINEQFVPDTVFGYCNDVGGVVISKRNYPLINAFYKNTSDKPSLEDLKLYQRHWYAKNDKGFLTEILDKFQAQDKRISNYIFPQRFKDGVYVYFKVSFDMKSNLPTNQKVISIDFFKNHYQLRVLSIVWIQLMQKS